MKKVEIKEVMNLGNKGVLYNALLKKEGEGYLVAGDLDINTSNITPKYPEDISDGLYFIICRIEGEDVYLIKEGREAALFLNRQGGVKNV